METYFYFVAFSNWYGRHFDWTTILLHPQSHLLWIIGIKDICVCCCFTYQCHHHNSMQHVDVRMCSMQSSLSFCQSEKRKRHHTNCLSEEIKVNKFFLFLSFFFGGLLNNTNEWWYSEWKRSKRKTCACIIWTLLLQGNIVDHTYTVGFGVFSCSNGTWMASKKAKF